MKPETLMIIGLIVFFSTHLINRFLGERNYATLSKEGQAQDYRSVSVHRSLGTYVPVGVMLLVLAVGLSIKGTMIYVFPIGVAVLIVFSFVMRISIFKALEELSVPDDYFSKFKWQMNIVQIGNLIFYSLLTYGIVRKMV